MEEHRSEGLQRSEGLSRRGFLVATAGALAPAVAVLPGPPVPRDLQWTNVVDWPCEGRAFAERKAPFDRLPAAAEGVVSDAVWNLSRHSAGMALRFSTDATELHVRYRTSSAELAMPHMPATGVSGVDLYARDGGGTLRWVQVSRPTTRTVATRLAHGLVPVQREYLLYLPLFNGVEHLELGTPEGTRPESLRPPRGKPIVVYGTSIAHGACASRPGMAWPAIVGRLLNREVVNLGFSGNGRMDPEVGRFVAQIDAGAFVVDCLPNMTAEQVRARTGPLVRQLRQQRPAAPILLVEDRTFQNAWLQPATLTQHEQRRTALREAVDALRREGVDRLHLLSGEGLLGADGDATTDGSHPNDLGMMRQAMAVAAALRPILA